MSVFALRSGRWVLVHRQQFCHRLHADSASSVSSTGMHFHARSGDTSPLLRKSRWRCTLSRCLHQKSGGSVPASSAGASFFLGLARCYLGMIEKRPVLTKAFTASFIFGVSDVTSQTSCFKFRAYAREKLFLARVGSIFALVSVMFYDYWMGVADASFWVQRLGMYLHVQAPFNRTTLTRGSLDSFDVKRTLRMAAYGFSISGPSLHLWFNFVSRILPKTDLRSTFKKIVLGQISYGPFITCVFFSSNAALQGESSTEILQRLKRDLVPTLLNGLVYWPM